MIRVRTAVATLVAALLVLVACVPPAAATLHTGPQGMALIREFEGEYSTVYLDPVGVPTQCYGATGAELLTLPPIATHAQCAAQLGRSLARSYEPHVARLFRQGGALRGLFNQHRFDALVSAVYNLGPGILERGRSLGDAIRSRNLAAVANALLLYDKAGGRQLLGLTRRRQAERALFLRPMGRFEQFPAYERRLIQNVDRLRGHTSRAARARRAELRARCGQRAERINRAARREHDWLANRRATRHAALVRRSR